MAYHSDHTTISQEILYQMHVRYDTISGTGERVAVRKNENFWILVMIVTFFSLDFNFKCKLKQINPSSSQIEEDWSWLVAGDLASIRSKEATKLAIPYADSCPLVDEG